MNEEGRVKFIGFVEGAILKLIEVSLLGKFRTCALCYTSLRRFLLASAAEHCEPD